MTLPRTILVPIDFSEIAETALDYAVALADKLEATVHVLNVVDLQGFQFSDLGAALTADTIQTIIAANQAALDRLAAARASTGRIGQVLLRAGDPREVIDQLARSLKVDLIVIGSHGRRGLKRLVLGSVAESIVRRAACPVLTVHPPV